MGMDEGVTAVDEVLELGRMDEELGLELELDTTEGDGAVVLEGMVEVLKDVMEGIVVELSVLELPTDTTEEALTLVVVVTLVDAELEVVVIGRMYPAILVLRRFAVLTNDWGVSVLIKHCPTPLPRAAPWL